MRLVFAGTPEPAVVALQKLIDSSHEVVAVLTRPDAPKGRGRSLHPSPVKALAVEHGIEVLTPTTLNSGTKDGDAIRETLKELAPDAIPVVAYGNLVPKDLLDLPKYGWVNLHFSLLPQWRGAAPVQAAIAHGDDVTGATTFRIDEGLDTGDILGTVTEEIQGTDTADDLLTRLAYSGADLLTVTMDGLESGTIIPRPQEGTPSHVGKITTADAEITWNQPATAVDRHIRAHTPGPGAWTMSGEQRFKIGPVTVDNKGDDVPALAPGELHFEKNAVYVGTMTAPVQLGTIQAPGKKSMNAADWARGLGERQQELRF